MPRTVLVSCNPYSVNRPSSVPQPRQKPFIAAAISLSHLRKCTDPPQNWLIGRPRLIERLHVSFGDGSVITNQRIRRTLATWHSASSKTRTARPSWSSTANSPILMCRKRYERRASPYYTIERFCSEIMVRMQIRADEDSLVIVQ